MSPRRQDLRELLDFLKILYNVVSDGNEVQAACVFCGKPDHLYYNLKERVWICHHCGEAGGHNKLEQGVLQWVVQQSQSKDRNYEEYWNERGLTDATVSAAGLGYYPLLGRYTIPYREGDRISNISFRASEEGQEPKYIRLPGVPAEPYVIETSNTEVCCIVEGEVDALTTWQSGVSAYIIGLPGASYINDRLIQRIPRGAKVIGIFDNDAAGKRAAAKLHERIPGSHTTFPPEDCKDVNELYLKAGGGAVRELISVGGRDAADVPGGSSGEGPRSIRGIPSSVYITLPDEQGDWLVEDLWIDQALGFLAGEPKAMKSLLALHLGYHIAEGKPFVGKRIIKPGPVLLYQEEDSDHIIKRRLASINSGRASGKLFVFTPSVVGTHFRLDSDDSLAALDDAIRELQPVLVILDPLANMHSLEDENNASAANKILERLRHMRDLRRTSFMVVHHLRKALGGESSLGTGQRMRGSSVFHAKSECALYVERTGNIVRINVESKIGPSRVLEIKYAGNQFILEDELGQGVEEWTQSQSSHQS